MMLSREELPPDGWDFPALVPAPLNHHTAFSASDCYERQQRLRRSSYLEKIAPPHQHTYVMKDAAAQQSRSLESNISFIVFFSCMSRHGFSTHVSRLADPSRYASARFLKTTAKADAGPACAFILARSPHERACVHVEMQCVLMKLKVTA